MKRRTILSSILVIIACIAVISGTTFALFTSESSVNIAITSGKVNVVATLDNLECYSATAVTTGLTDTEIADVAGTITSGPFAGTYYYDKLDGTTFTNKGKATIDPNQLLTLERVTPGDKVKVNVNIANNSNVKIQYRIRVNVVEGEDAVKSLKLFSGLKTKISGTEFSDVIKVTAWTVLEAEADIDVMPVEIYLPLEAGNEYQDLSTQIKITVEAVQSNAHTASLDAINTILANSNAKNNTMYDAIQEVITADSSYVESDFYPYVWNVDTDRFYDESSVDGNFFYKYFKAYDEMPTAQTYSIYAKAGWNVAEVAGLTVGFDAGNATGITTVTYDRSAESYGREVVIRTNSAGTTLTVNAPLDVLYRYGEAGTVSINAIAGNSYHEYGIVGFLEISKGRVALEADAKVANVHIVSKKEVVNEVEQTTNTFDEIVIAIDENTTKPTFSRDDVEISTQGTLVVAIQTGTEEITEDTKLDYVWLTKQGIFEQIKVSDNSESMEDAKWADDNSLNDTNTQEAAIEIANNIGRADANDKKSEIKVEVTVTKQEETKTYAVVLDENRDLVVVDTADTNTTIATLDSQQPLNEVQVGSETYTIALTTNQDDNKTEIILTNTDVNSDEVISKDATTNSGLTKEDIQEAKEEINDAVARIDTTYYKTFGAAYEAAKSIDTIYILKDFTLKDVVLFNKNTTIKGQNHEIKSSANRIFRVSQPNIDVKIYDFVMTSTCTVGDDERGISFDNVSSNSSLLLDNCVLSAEFYTINVVPGADNLTVTINNGTVAAGWAAINTYSKNSTFTIENSTLRGLNDKGESPWNNFNTITIDGNGYNKTSANSGSNNTVNIINSTVYSDSNSNNKQYWVGIQYGALNNTINVDSDSRIINSDGDDLINNFKVMYYYGNYNSTYGTWSICYDNSSNKIIVSNEEQEFYTPEIFYNWQVGPSSYTGLGLEFEDPFTAGLEDGEFITLLRNVTLNNDVTVPFENGVFYLTLGDYTITGDGLINLPQGVTLITDKAIDSLLVNPDGFEIIKSQIENGYSYKVSALKGSGTQENPFQIYDYATMQKVSEYYDLGYYYFEVALDKTENGAIDCANMWTAVNINGSFDGKGVIFNNLNNQLFRSVGKAPSDDIYTIKNITINANININGYGAAAIRQAGNNLVLDNVTVHGYIEGNNGASAFVCFGPGNIASSNSNAQPMNWTFRNCYSDATVVATGDVAVGFVKHPYCYASQQGGNATAQASCLLTIEDSIFVGKLSYVGTGVYSKKYFVGNANDMLVKTVYSNEFIAQYGNPEGTLYATPIAKTDDGIFFIGNYPGEGKKISGYTEYGTCVDTYLGTSAFLTVTAGSLPAKYETFTISKVENAVSAKVTLEVAPNGTNETGSYLGTFMSETINLENVSDTFSTSEIKYFDITINGDSTSVTGISADGKTFNIVGTNYGTTYNGAKLRVTQYDSNGNVINITTYTFANN